jgi:ubiquitin thioesterase protein OTUB1
VLDKIEAENDVETKLKKLFELFNEQAFSDYIVVYLRLITSGKLQEDAEFYTNFIDGYSNIAEFCKKEVEAMYRESDNVQLVAICAALGSAVRVEYMDRGSQTEVNAHDFSSSDTPNDDPPSVCLLYRPNHYDIIYK